MRPRRTTPVRAAAHDDVEDRVPGTEAAPPLEGGGAGSSFLRD
jgi:hypothetical protein